MRCGGSAWMRFGVVHRSAPYEPKSTVIRLR